MKIRIINGYRAIFKPNHPSAMKSRNWIGYIYEHRYVMEKILKRNLKSDEVVHHLDGDKFNNRHQNLIVLSNREHIKLHIWLNKGAPYIRDIGFNRNSNSKNKSDINICIICSKALSSDQIKCCSRKCHLIANRSKICPPRKILKKEINMYSFSELGRKYGVSDNAIRKWAKKMNIKF